MSKEKEIQEIQRIKSSLEYHYQKYKDYKYNSKTLSRKKDRDRALDNMITHSNYIERELQNSLVFNAISDGNQFQFEDFWRYVESDMSDYLTKIDSLLDKLKSEKEE